VPCSGGLDEPAAQYQVNELVRLAAARTHGAPRFIHAPYLPSDELRASILADPGVRATIALWDRLDAAVVGIGLPHRVDLAQGGTTTTPLDPSLLTAAGDVVQHYFDRDGRPLSWSGEARLLAISPDQLRRTPLVIGVAGSVAKAPGILGAARAGLVNVVVTDVATAQAVLELSGAPTPA
jgi:DNA-binding transcriptional regulator LsrR (DeoR family)